MSESKRNEYNKNELLGAVHFYFGAMAKSYPRTRRVATAPGIQLQSIFIGNTSFFGGIALKGLHNVIFPHMQDYVNPDYLCFPVNGGAVIANILHNRVSRSRVRILGSISSSESEVVMMVGK